MRRQVRDAGDGPVHPVHQEVGEVRHGITQGRQLPVQDGDDPGLGGVQDHVVQPIVAVHHGVAVLVWQGPGQPIHQALHGVELDRLGGAILLGPAVDLPAHVVAGLAEVRQAHGLDIGVVQVSQGLDLGHVDGPALGGLALGQGLVPEDPALDHVHDIEPGADHRLVGAEAIGTGHREARRI